MQSPGSAALPRVPGAPSPGMGFALGELGPPCHPPCVWGHLQPGLSEPLNRRAQESSEQGRVPAELQEPRGEPRAGSALAQPRLTLASLSGTPELMEGEKRSDNGAWGKPEHSVGSEGALGRQSSGRAGVSLPTAPSAPPRALLLRPLLCSTFLPSHQINHKTQFQGKGEGQMIHSLRTARCWPRLEAEEPEDSKPCPGLALQPLGELWGRAHDGGLPPALHSLVPLRCHSHGHRWMQDTVALD